MSALSGGRRWTRAVGTLSFGEAAARQLQETKDVHRLKMCIVLYKFRYKQTTVTLTASGGAAQERLWAVIFVGTRDANMKNNRARLQHGH